MKSAESAHRDENSFVKPQKQGSAGLVGGWSTNKDRPQGADRKHEQGSLRRGTESRRMYYREYRVEFGEVQLDAHVLELVLARLPAWQRVDCQTRNSVDGKESSYETVLRRLERPSL